MILDSAGGPGLAIVFAVFTVRRLLPSVCALICSAATLSCITGAGQKTGAPAATASRPSAALPTTAAKPAVILGYSASWADAAYPPAAYDYSGLTHIARSFLAPHADGSVTSASDFWSDELEKGAHAHGVKLLASIGGSAENANEWLGMARDAAAKARFFDTLESLVTAHHYDGVDIDWDGSEPQVGTQYSRSLCKWSPMTPSPSRFGRPAAETRSRAFVTCSDE